MENLWASWRKKYILEKKPTGCVFCEKQKEDDEKSFILYRGELTLVIMNIYPYNSGHIMVCPKRHTPCFSELTKQELNEFAAVSQHSIKILKNVISPEGFNTGMNLGKIAGAGIASHLHFHIVPRWPGDTNFMPVVGKTKVISLGLNETYQNLYPHFKELNLK